LGLSNSEVGGKGNPPPDGDYDIKIQKVIFKPSLNPNTKASEVWIVEYTIEAIRYQKASVGYEGEELDPAEVGEKRSWTAQSIHSQTAGRIKAFLFAVTGAGKTSEGPAIYEELCKSYEVDPKKYAVVVDVWDKIASLATDEVNPFRGLTVALQVQREETKKSKVQFPVHEFRPAAVAAA
jgi:hypothetical protein